MNKATKKVYKDFRKQSDIIAKRHPENEGKSSGFLMKSIDKNMKKISDTRKKMR